MYLFILFYILKGAYEVKYLILFVWLFAKHKTILNYIFKQDIHV